jgi:Tfp pilus assembly protein PilX
VEQDRGVALILALLVLSFLTVIGSALLTTSAIDIWISDNYKTATQSLYLAEAGISQARELIHASSFTLNELLNQSAGPDRQLLTADDSPLIASTPLIDSYGKPAGNYEVWLRNDNADGLASLADTNEVVTLVSRAKVGNSRKTLEVVIQKGRFPENDSDPRLRNVDQLESLIAAVAANATDSYNSPALTDIGGSADYRVIVAEGNLDLGPGIGYGLLLVRGELNVVGNVEWNGLILVVGQGVVRTRPGVSSAVNGGLFVARTRQPDGVKLAAPLGVSFSITDLAQIHAANRPFPYSPIAIRER